MEVRSCNGVTTAQVIVMSLYPIIGWKVDPMTTEVPVLLAISLRGAARRLKWHLNA